MMQLYIDNKELGDYFEIGVLEYLQALSFPAERVNERSWVDKSGVDKNLENIKYEPKEFVVQLYCKATNEATAYTLVKVLVDYMYTKGVFVLSLRDSVRNIRECYLCERSGTIVGEINIREINSLYTFKLGLKDVNPNALKFKNTIVLGETTIAYDKGQTASIYWGNGDRGLVSNSGDYTKDDYIDDGIVDIIVDIDADAEVVIPLVADFEATPLTGIKPLDVQFTDLSSGDIEIWSWNFGDGYTSAEQNPLHTYNNTGIFTVTLQIFNGAKGADTKTIIAYITIDNAKLLINDAGDSFLINDAGDEFLIN